MALRGTSVDANAALALDAGALASLKAQAKNAPGEALSKAAGQFEALFVSMVLKSMRDALPQDGPLASETTKTYTAMFDQQLALKLSDRGIGLRKAIEKQLARSLPASASTDAAAQPAASSPPSAPPSASPSPSPSSSSSSNAATRRIANAYSSAAVVRSADVAAKSTAPSSHDSSVASVVSSFIDKLRPQAEAAAKALGVPVQFILAQAGLETGWGRSQPKSTDGAASHNVFGVKAGRRWAGPIVQAKTTEYAAGNATQSTEPFRSYGSYAESFQDFVRLLKGSPRYADALKHAGDASRYAKSLQSAGYATDPAYAEKLTRAIALVSRHTGAEPPAQVLAGSADTRTDRA